MSTMLDVDFLLRRGHEVYMPNLSIDCVIFAFHEYQLKVMLTTPANLNKLSLPGGFIKWDESIDDAAHRTLGERTGLTDIYMEQFCIFGEPNRFNPELVKSYFKDVENLPTESWLFSRFVTTGYFALVEYDKVIFKPDIYAQRCIWYNVDKIPPLIHDHNNIISEAINRLKCTPVGIELLPKKFTLSELQKVYESILGITLDRRNFARKVKNSDLLIKLDEVKSGLAHKSPTLYKFNKRTFNTIMSKGGFMHLI